MKWNSTVLSRFFNGVRILSRSRDFSSPFAAAECHNTPQVLRARWVDSFPSNSDSVDHIISMQSRAYDSLVARLGRHVPDEERINRVRSCFSPALLCEFNDQLARAGIDASNMPWDKCIGLAREAQRVFAARCTHTAKRTASDPAVQLPEQLSRSGSRWHPEPQSVIFE